LAVAQPTASTGTAALAAGTTAAPAPLSATARGSASVPAAASAGAAAALRSPTRRTSAFASAARPRHGLERAAQHAVRGFVSNQLIAAGYPQSLPEPLAAGWRVHPAEGVLVAGTGDRQQRRADASETPDSAFLGHVGTEQDRRLRLPADRRRFPGRALAGQGGGGLRAEVEAGHHQRLPVDAGQARLAGLRPAAQLRQHLVEHRDARRQGRLGKAFLRQSTKHPRLRLGSGIDRPTVGLRLHREHRVAGLGPGPAPLRTGPAALAESRQIEDQRHPLRLLRHHPADLDRLPGDLPLGIPAAHRQPRGRPIGARLVTLEAFTGRPGRFGTPGAGGQRGTEDQRQGKTQEDGFRHSHGLRDASERRSMVPAGVQGRGQCSVNAG